MSDISRRDSSPVQAKTTIHNRGAHVQSSSTGMRTEVYQGLVPHPEHVERYEALQPGATDRFIGMAERQSEHRQTLEKRHLAFNGFSQILGVLFAGITVLGGLAAGTYLIINDKPVSGLVSLLLPLATVAGIFIDSKRSQRAELKAKQQALAPPARRKRNR